MPNSSLSLFLGVTATALVLTPTTAVAQTFDFNRVENLPGGPIESDSVLSFFGDIANNEGYLAFRNEDPTAPDAGHIDLRPGTDNARYYIVGPGRSPDPATRGTRSVTLEGLTGLPNFSNYLKENDIPLNSIGFDFLPKSDRDLTKTWNLGEDKQGQDWFGSADSPIEESIYQANPDDVENFLTFGTTKIIDFGYTPFYFVSANDNP
ncbi:MAG: PEP-CTERM sorting domain-containing protein, partial [Moorea sp. SIO2I5]|nr:PEP-CTERM sorting domain-containing protein [Moorena sp. SIO2I5]